MSKWQQISSDKVQKLTELGSNNNSQEVKQS